MDEQKKPTVGFWAAVVAAVLVPLAMYVGAYLALVQAVTVITHIGQVFTLPDGSYELSGFPRVARYRWPWSGNRIETEFVVTLFGPVHKIDRKVRAHMWKPEPRGTLFKAAVRSGPGSSPP